MAQEFNRLTIFAGKHDAGAYNWSPFVNKLQARLRFEGVSHDVAASTLSKAPMGKIPFVGLPRTPAVDGGDPFDLMGDTAFIIKHLVGTGVLKDLNRDLEPAEAALDLGVRSILEDKLYFIQACIARNPHTFPCHVLTPALDARAMARERQFLQDA